MRILKLGAVTGFLVHLKRRNRQVEYSSTSPSTTLLGLWKEGGMERKSHLCIPSSGETGGRDPAAFSSVSMHAEVLSGIRLRKSDGE